MTLRLSANVSFLFPGLPLLKRIDAAASAGFDAVEMLFPYAHSAQGLKTRLHRHGLTVTCINTAAGDWEAGERGFAAVPGCEARFAADLDQAVHYAKTLEAAHIHVMAGNAQGPEARETFIANLRHACEAAPDQTFTIEPLNPVDAPGYHFSTLDEATQIIAAVDTPNLRLQFDLYHVQMAEGRVLDRMAAVAPLISHVQMASVPGRHEPDTGELNIALVLHHLFASGYTGWLGCEYRPRGDTLDGLVWRDRLATALHDLKEAAP